ncbi:MAG: hypothetical protein ACRDY4_14530 [Acidimicrobiia bacterium]
MALAAAAYTHLHELRLRGKMPARDGPEIDALCADGLARRRGTFLVLTPEGRACHAGWARLAPGSQEEAAARRAYDQFLPLNVELLRVVTDWQVRPGNVANDHRDPGYDWAVLDRLTTLDERTGPIVRRLGSTVERFAGYRTRLRAAVRRLHDGGTEWLSSPAIDSYHTVWMQLHEDLLLALGLER